MAAEWSLRVDAVEVVQGDAVGPEPAQALLDLAAEHLRAAAPGAAAAAALGCHYAAIGDRRESRANRLFALPTGVGVSGVDHPHPGGERRLDERDVAVRFRQSVGSEPDASHIEVTKLH